jgi:predicted O-methyltransferase YrrM
MRQEQIKTIVKRFPGTTKAYSALTAVTNGFRALCFRIQGRTHYRHTHPNAILAQALAGETEPSDISDHLGVIFCFAINATPTIMVELGTRGGESTRALLAAASITKSTLLSVDIEECGQLSVPFRERWHFVKADDVSFGKRGFEDWCRGRAIEPVIDFLFIDTSHQYEHTRQEIEVWSKYLSEDGTVVLHDTNMGSGVYARSDGSIGFGWDNRRGVMRVVEELVDRQYDETTFFCDVTDAFSVIHFPNCNGLTVVRKLKKDP